MTILASSLDARVENLLAAKSYDIVTSIKVVLQNRLSGDDMSGPCNMCWSDQTEARCKSFFSPENLHRLLIAFWSIWSPNCPIIHKPTFKEDRAPATLVATMVLMGACLTSLPEDLQDAAIWFNAIEEWVFTAPELSDDKLLPADSRLQSRLDALRAAYIIILLQTWEGSDGSKRRARRARYAQVTGVARSFLSNARVSHGDLQMYLANPSEDSWLSFATVEDVIRTLTYVFLLDTAWVIFHNTPPRMAVQEIRIACACPETVFQATDVQSWAQMIQDWATSEIGRRQPTIWQLVTLLWTNQPSQEDWRMLQEMSSLNFFTTASGDLRHNP